MQNATIKQESISLPAGYSVYVSRDLQSWTSDAVDQAAGREGAGQQAASRAMQKSRASGQGPAAKGLLIMGGKSSTSKISINQLHPHPIVLRQVRPQVAAAHSRYENDTRNQKKKLLNRL